MKICSVEGCEGRSRTKGMCYKHYAQMHKYGRLTPEFERGNKKVVVEVVEDKPAKVEVKAKRLSLSLAQLVHSPSDVFWRWNRENPIGWPRAENSRLRLPK